MLVERNFDEYVKFCFEGHCCNIEKVYESPKFPTLTGDHNTIKINNGNVIGEATSSSDFPNLILYKINIDTDTFLEKQKRVVFEFAKMIINTEIIKVSFFKEINDNPMECYVHFLIEFGTEQNISI